MDRTRRVAAVFAAALLLAPLCAAGIAGATGQSINSTRTVTTTVNSGAHDNFAVTPPSGKLITAKVTVTSGGPIDVYVMSSRDLSDYENPTVPTFGYERTSAQNTRSWSGTVSTSGTMTLVVDNEIVATTGASPTGDVTYTAEFTVGEGLNPLLVGGVVLILIIALAVGVRALRNRRLKANWQAPAQGAPPGTEQLYGAQTPYAQYPAAGQQVPSYPQPSQPTYPPQPPYQPPQR